MKKLLIGFAALALVVAFLSTTGAVFAQAGTPPTPQAGNGAYGQGARMGGGGVMMNTTGTEGPLHDYLVAAFADKLGMTVADLEARLDSGTTVGQVAADKGLTLDQFRTLMQDARSQASAKAVADGVLTQAQADWMSQRGPANAGRGAGMGRGAGARGAGMGAGNFANCPYLTQ